MLFSEGEDEGQNASIPALFRSLLSNVQVGFCYPLFEPLAFSSCPHFYQKIATESFNIASPILSSNDTSDTIEQLGMHLSAKVKVSILSSDDVAPADNLREDLLVVFLLPRGLFVDMYELEVL
jgi:hypothetical protein